MQQFLDHMPFYMIVLKQVLFKGRKYRLRKIAVFAEGQTELIFFRDLVFRLVDNSKLSLECFSLISNSYHEVPFSYHAPEPELYFMIVNVQNDKD